jgi:RNA polymerase sigma-70 factor (ECF subfamily)
MQMLQSIFPLVNTKLVQPEDILIRRENKAELWRAVGALGEKYQLPLTLFYGHQLPVAEIAQVLDIPVGTVLSRLHTARERLAVMLCNENESEMHYEVSEL